MHRRGLPLVLYHMRPIRCAARPVRLVGLSPVWSAHLVTRGYLRWSVLSQISAGDRCWRQAWSRSQMRRPFDGCLAVLAHQRETKRLERAIRQIDSGPTHRTTNVFGPNSADELLLRVQ
jgi:hypothetical protein